MQWGGGVSVGGYEHWVRDKCVGKGVGVGFVF